MIIEGTYYIKYLIKMTKQLGTKCNITQNKHVKQVNHLNIQY